MNAFAIILVMAVATVTETLAMVAGTSCRTDEDCAYQPDPKLKWVCLDDLEKCYQMKREKNPQSGAECIKNEDCRGKYNLLGVHSYCDSCAKRCFTVANEDLKLLHRQCKTAADCKVPPTWHPYVCNKKTKTCIMNMPSFIQNIVTAVMKNMEGHPNFNSFK